MHSSPLLSFLFPFTVKKQFPLCHWFTLRRWEQAATCNYPCSHSRGSLGAEQQLALPFPSPLTHTHSHTPARHPPPAPPDSFPPILHIHLPSSLINKANAYSDASHRHRGEGGIKKKHKISTKKPPVCEHALCNIFMHRKVISHPVSMEEQTQTSVGREKWWLRNKTEWDWKAKEKSWKHQWISSQSNCF